MKTTHPLRFAPAASAVGTIIFLISLAHGAPVTMNGAGSYSQDFNTLITTGTGTWSDDSTIASWYSQRTGTGTSIAAGAGASNSGNLYSYGTGTDAERALGTIGSGNSAAGSFAHGLLLQNTGTSSVTVSNVSYRGEQWRNGGGTDHTDTMTFAYKVSGSVITALEPGTDTGWTNVTTLDFSSLVLGGTAAAMDGNANFTAKSAAPGITVPPGSYVMLRWRDIDHPGGDHGLSIDDLSMTWVVESQPAVVLNVTPTDFEENDGPTAAAGTVTIPAALGSDLVVTLASSDTTEATVPPTVTITAGNTSANFSVAAVDDFLVEANPQPVNLTASATGYTTGQFQVNVADDGIDTAIGILITPDTFGEEDGDNVATGTVQIAQNTATDLVVTLTSLDTTEVTVPASVTILAGSDTATFPVNAVNDVELDGNRTVTVRATATGYTQGSTTVTVEDDGDTPPQPTLDPGEIAIVGFNADGQDSIAFVPLVPIAAGDIVLFTDNEWNGGTVNTEGGDFVDLNEGTLTWTAPAGGVAAGQVVLLNAINNSNRAASVGTLTSSGTLDLTVGGDTFYVYQGAPLFPTGFITAFSNGTMESIVGTGLSEDDVITVTSGADIGAYSGLRNNKPTFVGYFAQIANTASNWTIQDTASDDSLDGTFPDVPFATTAFTLSAGGNNFASWATDNGIPGALPGDDFDKDGLSNLLEYAMGLDPKVNSQPVGTLVNGLLTYPKGADAVTNGDVTYKIQTSTTLAAGSWTDVTETETPTSISFQLTVPPGAPGKIFARLEVTQVTP